MTRPDLLMAAAVGLAALGITVALLARDNIRRIIALNIGSGGVMMLLIVLAFRADPEQPDPIPQALVLTGIVIMVAVTAVALALIRTIESDDGDGK